jgi:hypothetical protein
MIERLVVKWLGASDGTQMIFTSGLLVGLAGNMFVSAIVPTDRPSNYDALMWTAALWGIGSVFLAMAGWLVQRLDQVAREEAQDTKASLSAVKARYIGAAAPRLMLLTVGALAATVLGAVQATA